MITKTCDYCGKELKTRKGKTRFCSPECSSLSQRKEYICKECGKPFWRKNAFRMKYCGKECMDAARQKETEARREARAKIKPRMK